jgi:hypothetical protein
VRGWSAGGGDALEGRGGGGDDEQGDADGEPEGPCGAARHEGEAGGERHADEGDRADDTSGGSALCRRYTGNEFARPVARCSLLRGCQWEEG